MPLTIHHSTVKKAEKEGVVLTVDGQQARAFIPSIGALVFGVSGADALKQVNAVRTIYEMSEGKWKFKHSDDPRVIGWLVDEQLGESENGTPVQLLGLMDAKTLAWKETVDDITQTFEPEAQQPADGAADPASPLDGNGSDFAEDTYPKEPVPVAIPPIARNENGVPYDGAIAYREGISAADCPYSSEETDDEDEYDKFVAWNEAWDAAADEKAEADEEESKGGSVVKSKYRTKYKEEGHPNHCGDWLAELLNNYCIGDKNTDLETFERICSLNGVDTSKYRREGVGWQGRIRMTGRNLLAKVVFKAGKIVTPDGDKPAPADWIAAQRYNKPESK